MEQEKILVSKAAPNWKLIQVKHHHGVCLLLSSLRSQETSGIGDFSCLPPLIDWLASLGMDVLQLLPINDTAGVISPYSLASAFALNPLYLTVAPYATRTEKKLLSDLNNAVFLQYDKIRKLKLAILWRQFQKQREDQEPASPEIEAYAAWAGGNDPEKVRFVLFLQRMAFEEMESVKRYASEKGVFIKGDLPILISKRSFDFTFHKDLFLPGLSVGAPPDAFSQEGQNWGFPPYNYAAKLEEIKGWWYKRLQAAERLYHLCRIDHAVGFFRLWVIAQGKKATDGRFFPEDPKESVQLGKELFSHFLLSSEMLPIAEDLGSVPSFVRKELNQLGIPGTKVMRWEEDHPAHYPSCSMTTVSTHDTETLHQWWESDPQAAKKFADLAGIAWSRSFSQQLCRDILRLAHHSNSLFHINLLQEYFPLAAGLTWKKHAWERINVPGGKKRSNWRIRYKPFVEEFTANAELKAAISALL